ncbi:MAG: 2-oxo acid dehydrogenase subunit E2 [Deltaproteobacteria bacterium]|nr:2-oxo acid dehydrogenase subunit E2 [Deltaproteobacteria bacterium]
MPNVDLTPQKLSSWRKIALGSWHSPGDPSVYGTVEFNASKLVERQKRWAEQKNAKAPTVTAITTRATALMLVRHPQINGLIRWGRIYNRKDVAIFLQTAVDEAGKDLSGFVIYEAEKKSLEQVMGEIASKAKAIREDRDPNFKKAKSTFGSIPAFAMRCVLNTMSFLLYTLNLDLSWAGLPKDPFGSVMITSIGSLGMDEAYGPLVGYSRVPLLMAVGAVRERAVVLDGKLAIAPTFKICVTFDHRFIDGVLGAKMVKTFRQLIETDAGLDELGLK